MPESHWDTQMQQTAQRISYETGKPVTYVLGSIRIRQADGSVSAARGVYTENGIIVQADHRYLNIDQIADHEAFHDYAANNPGLVRQIERDIVEQYSREEFDAIMDKYLKNLRLRGNQLLRRKRRQVPQRGAGGSAGAEGHHAGQRDSSGDTAQDWAARALQLRRRERKHSRSEDTRPRTGASDAG